MAPDITARPERGDVQQQRGVLERLQAGAVTFALELQVRSQVGARQALVALARAMAKSSPLDKGAAGLAAMSEAAEFVAIGSVSRALEAAELEDEVVATTTGLSQTGEVLAAPPVLIASAVNKEIASRARLIGLVFGGSSFGKDLDRRADVQHDAAVETIEVVTPGLSQGRFGVDAGTSERMLSGATGGLDVGRALREGDALDIAITAAGRAAQVGVTSVDALAAAGMLARGVSKVVTAVRGAVAPDSAMAGVGGRGLGGGASGGEAGVGGKAALAPEASIAGVGDEVQSGAKAPPSTGSAKGPGADEAPVGPADSRQSALDGPPPKGEPKTEPEPVSPEEPTAGKGDKDCKCDEESGDSTVGEGTESGGEGSRVPGGPKRTPSDWTPDEASRRVDELAKEGHGPQRHEGQVTPEDHARRVLDGRDPASGSAQDFVHGGQHHAPATSSSFTSNEAYAQAESSVRASPQFQAKAASGKNYIEVEQSLSAALGPGYRDYVFGVTKSDPRSTLNAVDFTGGKVVARYRLVDTPQGAVYRLVTMFAEPR